MLVQSDHAAHHPAISLKTAVPVSVGEHDVRSAVRTMLIGPVKEAAQIWLNSEHVEVVPGHLQDPGAGWIFARIQAD